MSFAQNLYAAGLITQTEATQLEKDTANYRWILTLTWQVRVECVLLESLPQGSFAGVCESIRGIFAHAQKEVECRCPPTTWRDAAYAHMYKRETLRVYLERRHLLDECLPRELSQSVESMARTLHSAGAKN